MNARRLPVRNDSGEVIPRGAVLRVTGVATVRDEPVFVVAKPSSNVPNAMLLVNLGGPIGVGGYGEASRDWPLPTWPVCE